MREILKKVLFLIDSENKALGFLNLYHLSNTHM